MAFFLARQPVVSAVPISDEWHPNVYWSMVLVLFCMCSCKNQYNLIPKCLFWFAFYYFSWNFFFAHAHLLKLAEISNSLALPWCQAQVWWLMLLGLHQSTYFALHVEKMFTKKKMPSFYLARYPKPRWDVVPSTSEWLTAMNVCEYMKLPRDLHVMVGGPDLTRLSWILVQIGNF